eukprot:9041934-Pyramimonas_sp.AAC.1
MTWHVDRCFGVGVVVASRRIVGRCFGAWTTSPWPSSLRHCGDGHGDDSSHRLPRVDDVTVSRRRRRGQRRRPRRRRRRRRRR